MNSIMAPQVTIIIVTYNSEDEIIGCLDSIFANPVLVIVYVVDNNSVDGTKALLKSYAERDSRVKLILNDDNKGLAEANNQPLPYIESEYTLILNPDILLRPDSLQVMINAMKEDTRIGMLGPLSLFEDGEPHKSAFLYYNIFTIIKWRVFPHTLMRMFFDRFSTYKKKEVLFVSGACYLIPTKLYKELNGYDKAFFLTISDVADIGVRIRKMGYKAMFYPGAVITHFSGRSNAPLKYLTQYWGLTGDLYFIKKHKGNFQLQVVKFTFVLSSLLRGGVFKLLSWIVSKSTFSEKAKLYLDLAKSVWNFVPTSVL
jgi:GT2 family glycosyltransferase